MSELQEGYLYIEKVARPDSFLPQPTAPCEIAPSIPPGGQEFLRKHGAFSAYDGRLMSCFDGFMAGVLTLIFGGDDDFHHRDVTCVAYTAFGKLLCWSEKLRKIEIDLLRGTVECPALFNEKKRKADPEIFFESLLHALDIDILDEEDDDGKLLFERAQEKLGPLGYGQCFGFSLALPLGGYKNLDMIDKFSAPEYFSILAQLQTFTLIDWGTTQNFGLRTIREIG